MVISVIYLILSYLVGTFPTGKLIAKAHNVEIEKLGSGNVGATNIARNLGKTAGVLTLAGDVAKGLLVVKLAQWLSLAEINGVTLVALSSLAVVMGHCFSLPGLKGGKGVAAALGVLIGLTPMIASISLLIFICILTATQYVSVASIIAVLSAPAAAFIVFPDQDFSFALAVIALLITYRHRENIQRLIEGRESKFKV